MLPASISRSPVGARYIYPERSRRIVRFLSFSSPPVSVVGACPDRVGALIPVLLFTDYCLLITDFFPLSHLECAVPQIAPITPLKCAVPKTRHLKSFRMRSSEKSGGRGANC
jgi:hypothetical protein